MGGRALFIGGPGTISRGAIGALVAGGWDVSVLTHVKDPIPDLGARFLWGDRDDEVALRTACDEVQPDVVIDTCCYTTDQVSQALDVFAAPGRQYVFVSTVDVFGYPLARLPVRESDEHREPNSPYALAKRDCESLVSAAGAAGHVTVTIIRPGYSMGPRFLIGFFSRQGGRTMLRRMQEGKQIVVPGDGTVAHPVGSAWADHREWEVPPLERGPEHALAGDLVSRVVTEAAEVLSFRVGIATGRLAVDVDGAGHDVVGRVAPDRPDGTLGFVRSEARHVDDGIPGSGPCDSGLEPLEVTPIRGQPVDSRWQARVPAEIQDRDRVAPAREPSHDR
jgi:hypothetical protein